MIDVLQKLFLFMLDFAKIKMFKQFSRKRKDSFISTLALCTYATQSDERIRGGMGDQRGGILTQIVIVNIFSLYTSLSKSI
jgi:hypothetical protein